jgi:hypothetical protein
MWFGELHQGARDAALADDRQDARLVVEHAAVVEVAVDPVQPSLGPSLVELVELLEHAQEELAL